MKKTYKTFNGENRNCFFTVGKALVEARFTPTYTTDDELVQKAIEDTNSFKVGAILLTTPSLQWLPIDRDENGFATEECLEAMRKAIPFVYVATKEVYIAIGNENDFNVYIDGFQTDAFDVTHYLPIPKLEQ